MKPSSEKAKSASKVSSRGSLEGRVPRLRFPSFEGEWKCQIFGSAFDFIPNNTLSRSELTHDNGSVKNIHYGDVLVKFGAVIDFEHDAVPFIVNRSVSASERRLRDGDVVIADTAEDEAVGKASEVVGLKGAYAESGLHTMACRPRQRFAPRFMGYCLNSTAYHHRLLPLMQGIKVFSLSKSQISKTEIYIPYDEAEQQQIADFLSLIDSRIAAQRKLVALLKKQKRGLIEQIFGLRLPVGDSVKEWKTVELRDLFTKVARRNRDGKVKNVITNSAEFGLIPQKDFFDKSIAVDGNTDGYYVIRTGDFVYNPRKSTTAPFGPFNRYTGTADGIISPLYTCLVPKGNANPEYLAWYFQSTAWHRYVYDNGSQGARHDRVNMTDDLLFGIPVLLPSIMVQAQITDCLNAIDARWAAATEMLKQIEQIKRGLLQQMFA